MSIRARHALIAIGVGLTVCGSGEALRLQGFRINATPSEPLGLWRQTALSRIAPGKLVSACLPLSPQIAQARLRGYLLSGHCPGKLAPVIKSIAALPGDRVRISASGVYVNGQLLSRTMLSRVDSLGRPLIPAFAGDRLISAGEVFLISNYSPRSYDSRYFGVIPVANIQAEIQPVLVTRWKPEGF